MLSERLLESFVFEINMLDISVILLLWLSWRYRTTSNHTFLVWMLDTIMMMTFRIA